MSGVGIYLLTYLVAKSPSEGIQHSRRVGIKFIYPVNNKVRDADLLQVPHLSIEND